MTRCIVVVQGGTIRTEVTREIVGRAPKVKDGTYLWEEARGVHWLVPLEYPKGAPRVEVEF